MSLQPGQLDLIIYVGSTFSEVWTTYGGCSELIDLTGCSATLNMYTQSGYPTAFITLTTANGGIVFSSKNSVLCVVNCTISSTVTASLPIQSGFYNFEITSPSGIVTRLLQGNVSVMQ